MLRLLPLVFLLAACGTTNYSDSEDVRETCRDLGLEGAAFQSCVERREREAECRKFVNSREYSAAEARRRGCRAL